MKTIAISSLLIASLALLSCTNMTKTQQGAATGALVGAGAGLGISAVTGGNMGMGALVGGGLGAVAGGLYGHQKK